MSNDPREGNRGIPLFPPDLKLRSYQLQAIENWFVNRGRGTLKMATGSGKTVTALAIMTELYTKIGLKVLLVVCPYRHLVSQWSREAEKFNLQPILAFENVHQWQSDLGNQLYNIHSGYQKFLTVITTNGTFITESLQSQIRYFPEKTLIIGDEVHNLGARTLERSLPRNIGLRLGLSATPERYFDEEGTEALLSYFGSVLQPELTLKQAIQQGALVHYLYYPMLVELTDSETRAYTRLTSKISWALLTQKVPSIDCEELKPLLMKRARIIACARNKIQTLRSLMRSRHHTSHTLFYCGDGFIERETDQLSQRQLTEVTRVLGTELGYRVNTYTAETTVEERELLRQQFERGDLQGLVAIRCLDEGVDIPAIQNAVILSSSSNPRQFIQRRGRILRPYPGKKRATLFDMIVLPPDLGRETLDVERNLLKRELRRFLEFSDLADNSGEARSKLLELQERYQLLDL